MQEGPNLRETLLEIYNHTNRNVFSRILSQLPLAVPLVHHEIQQIRNQLQIDQQNREQNQIPLVANNHPVQNPPVLNMRVSKKRKISTRELQELQEEADNFMHWPTPSGSIRRLRRR